jgi:glycine dehydrogenase subunit 2
MDLLIATLRDLAKSAKAGDLDRFKQPPRFAPRRRLAETKAAREPMLTWKAPIEHKEAAE